MSVANPNTRSIFEPDNHNFTKASYSSLTLHRKCPQAWNYRYIRRLERLSEVPAPYLTIGTWWSALRAVEALSRGREQGTLIDEMVPKKITDENEHIAIDPKTAEIEDVFSQSATSWNSKSQEEKELFVEKLGEPLPERLKNMFRLWDRAHDDRWETEEVLGAEVYWERELPRSKDDPILELIENSENLPKMKLLGFIDEMYWDRKREMIVIRDHKAQRDLSNANSSLDDLMDSQLHLYAWGIAPELSKYTDRKIGAVAYDRIKSEAPKRPVLTASGALSKSVTAYDRDTYVKWATEDTRPSEDEIKAVAEEKKLNDEQVAVMRDLYPGQFWGKLGEFYATGAKKGQPKFGTYMIEDEVLERLNTPTEIAKWTSRTLDPISRWKVLAHLKSASDTSLDILLTQTRAEVSGYAPRNLDRRGCQFCDFSELCRAELVGGVSGEYDYAAYGLREKDQK